VGKIGLNKAMIVSKADLVTRLRKAHENVSKYVSICNQAMDEHFTNVEEAVNEYNAIVSEANEFQQTVAGDAQSEFDEKTEKWQEGEVGQSVSEFISLWEEELEELTIDRPDDLEDPGTDAIDAFLEKPIKPGDA